MARKNWKLARIIELINEISEKRFKRPSAIGPGFFGETGMEEAMSQAMSNRQSARQSQRGGAGFGEESAKAQSAVEKSTLSIWSQEGRNLFRDVMMELQLRHLKILKKVTDVQSDEIIKRLLVQEVKCLLRVYIVGAYGLAQRDNDSDSDPFTIVKLGKKKTFSDRDNWKLNEPNPDIYKEFCFEAIFPGCPEVSVEMWDYDLLFGDELIGITKVDMEDRYFSADWKSITHKPVEHRQLYHPSSAVS